MQRWEHHYTEAGTPAELYERIAAEGEHGWELVAVTGGEGSAAARQMTHGRTAVPAGSPPGSFQAWFKRPKSGI